MKLSGELVRMAKDMVAYDVNSPEGNILDYLYGHVGVTATEISRNLKLDPKDAVGIMVLWRDAEGSLRGGQGGSAAERRMLGEIRKTLARSDSSGNSLDGMSNERARKEVYQLMSKETKGIFRDESWEPVTAIFKLLTNAGIDWTLLGTQYRTNSEGNPTSKEWKFEVSFTNKNGRPTKMVGTIVASGAGSVEVPLSAYDLVAYVF